MGAEPLVARKAARPSSLINSSRILHLFNKSSPCSVKLFMEKRGCGQDFATVWTQTSASHHQALASSQLLIREFHGDRGGFIRDKAKSSRQWLCKCKVGIIVAQEDAHTPFEYYCAPVMGFADGDLSSWRLASDDQGTWAFRGCPPRDHSCERMLRFMLHHTRFSRNVTRTFETACSHISSHTSRALRTRSLVARRRGSEASQCSHGRQGTDRMT